MNKLLIIIFIAISSDIFSENEDNLLNIFNKLKQNCLNSRNIINNKELFECIKELNYKSKNKIDENLLKEIMQEEIIRENKNHKKKDIAGVGLLILGAFLLDNFDEKDFNNILFLFYRMIINKNHFHNNNNNLNNNIPTK